MKNLLLSTAIAFGLAGLICPNPAEAGAAPLLGEISWFAGNFAPRGWEFCDGQLLQISDNMALFSLLGTTYGGDGRTTFALPDMRGRTPVHAGRGNGLTARRLGQILGDEFNIMSVAGMPRHSHGVRLIASSSSPNTDNPSESFLATSDIYASFAAANIPMRQGTVVEYDTGGGQPINIMQPSLVINCIIATTGLYPSRN